MSPVHIGGRFDRADRRDGSTAFRDREAYARPNALQMPTKMRLQFTYSDRFHM
jgi:hypothetical protein